MSLMGVLRSSVLRLITTAHDPKVFVASEAAQRRKQEAPNPPVKPPLSPSVVQLSSLVIDLTAPRFMTRRNRVYGDVESLMDTDIQFFLPPLNPVQLHFLQRLRGGCAAVADGMSSCLSAATKQFYDSSPPPCHAGCHPLDLLQEYKTLNSGQQEVVNKVLASQDYTLLLGMPGSGKTSTLSFVIRTLVSRGERVLITSYTHTAVDNLMSKLKEAGVTPTVMGRAGHAGSVDSSMTEFVVGADSVAQGTVKHLSDQAEGYRIIGATVLTAARNGLLQKLAPFDWCVMDEAGQISQPAALGGMLLAKKHLLVGDDYQLPPLVVSLEAQVEVSVLCCVFFAVFSLLCTVRALLACLKGGARRVGETRLTNVNAIKC